MRHAALIGETRHALAEACAAAGVAHTVCADLAEAVRTLSALAVSGDHALLSPGFASLDQFAGYADRGDQFVKLVRNLSSVTAAR